MTETTAASTGVPVSIQLIFGQVDTLANNAGVFVGKPFTDFTCAKHGPNFAGAASSVQPGHRPRISLARHARHPSLRPHEAGPLP
jgi:gamma-glutamyltranspeptidase